MDKENNLSENQVDQVEKVVNFLSDMEKQKNLRDDISKVLNSHGIDSIANTPDFLLAYYAVNCINTYIETNSLKL